MKRKQRMSLLPIFLCTISINRANPTATTAKNPKLPERWAYEYNHFGVLAELAKVKDLEVDIMSSSLGELVQREEEREWRRKKDEEEREWRRKMLEQYSNAVKQQQEWQKEVVGMLKQQNRLNSLIVNSLLELTNQPGLQQDLPRNPSEAE